MGNWGDAVRIWAAIGVGARFVGGCPPQSGDCHRLPPSAKALPLSAKALPLSAKGLPLSAKTCHHLPQAASSWGGRFHAIRSGPGRGLERGTRGMCRLGFRLRGPGGLDWDQWPGTPLIAKRGRRTTSRPVTVCHIGAAGLRCWDPAGMRMETRTKRTEEEDACSRGFRRGRRRTNHIWEGEDPYRTRGPGPNTGSEHEC